MADAPTVVGILRTRDILPPHLTIKLDAKFATLTVYLSFSALLVDLIQHQIRPNLILIHRGDFGHKGEY